MNDTKKRITKYKEILPHMKEKVAAVALLLAMSTTMLVTVSFAWLALSSSPEVKGVNTSIASNGNLEIALVGAEGKIPNESAVGDGNLPLIERNITWGNLVNLSDSKYGLDNIVLRPATLNADNLLTSPLKGAIYTVDGRVEQLSSDFAYASWVQNPDGKTGYFEIPQEQQYGVRAITSTMMGESGGYVYEYETRKSAVKSANSAAGSAYINITQNREWMETLATVMGTYMTVKVGESLGSSDPTLDTDDIIKPLCDMFGAFVEVFDQEAKALAELANFQLFVLNAGDTSAYTPFTAETLLAQASKLSSMGIQITNLTGSTGFISDYNTLMADYAKLKEIYETASTKGLEVKWSGTEGVANSDLNTIANHLVNIGTCTIQVRGTSDAPVTINSFGGSGALNALNYRDKSCNTVITNGILKRFEERTGERVNVGKEYNNGQGLQVSASAMSVNVSIYAHITTNAKSPSLFSTDLAYAESKNEGGTAVLNVKDTYGIAIDMWVRTNAVGSYLTLEGNVLTEEEEVDVFGKDMNGNTTQIYTISFAQQNEAGESVFYTFDLYKLSDANGNETWYDADTHKVCDDLHGQTPKKKVEIVENIIGYEGENRIWEDRVNAGLSVNSTSQGSGSCYVFYADDPADQARSLELLGELKVAFIDAKGTLLATAYMDTNRYFADSGKVIVPMTLEANGISLGSDENGDPILAITALEQNVATRITAIVYLDGSKLTNDDVLSSADIQGQINIQFGSNKKLEHVENEALRQQEVAMTATIDQTDFDYDTAPEGSMTSNIELNINGYQPEKVTAFFIRSINSTQGSREEEMVFELDPNSGTWKASYTFNAPGTYILRSVQLDGIDYEVDTEPVNITSEGYSVKSLTWNAIGDSTTIMTAKKSESVELYLEFMTAQQEKMPNTVVGRFQRNEDGIVSNVQFTYNTTRGQWIGTATFLTSGDYTLQYLILDGEPVEIAENLRKYATVYLGMKVKVGTTSPTQFLYIPDEMTDNQKNLSMNVVVMDDTGREMPGLTNVKLYYRRRGTTLAENGLDADMTWNASSGRYEGVFNSKIGMYDFLRVVVGENIITEATSSPSFIILSPVPPTFNSGVTPSFQYAPAPATAPAKLSVQLNDAEALSYIKAVMIKDGVEQETLVDGYLDTTGNWSFPIPIDEAGGQDGTWAIKEIRIAGVYSADGVEYTEDAPLVFDLTGKAGVETNVVSKINVKLDSEADVSKSGSFLESYTLDSFGIKITDKNGHALPGISNITMKYNYKQDSLAKGGYTINDISTDMGDFTVTLVNDGTGTHFIQQTATAVNYAGTYELDEITFTIGESGTISVNLPRDEALPKAPTITVTSTAPSVAITARTAYGSSSNTATSATVYFNTTTNTTCGITTTNYNQPYVTITLSNIGNASGATLTFAESAGGTVHLYESNGGTTATNEYKWTGNGICQRWVGSYESVSAGNDKKTAAGTLTATKLVLTQGNVTFEVDIADITIINPS